MTPRLLAAAALAVALPVLAEAQTAPELSYGANITSNYIFRGTTQTNDNPAVQGYVEAAVGLVYGGVWASTVDLEDGNQFEFDFYAGVRPSFGNLSLDVNYTRYVYDDTGDCCGEFGLLAGYPIADIGELASAFYYDPDAETSWTELGSLVYFAEVWEVGGTVATDFGSLDLGNDDKVAWDIGVSRTLANFAAVDLRYYDSNYDPGRAVVSISADF